MARSSRKRRKRRRPAAGAGRSPATAAGAAAATPSRQRAARRAAAERRDERPPAPWGSFPLVELVVLVALAMLVGGFVVGGGRGSLMIGTGLALGSLAGLELSIREHFAGYRSHTLLLSGFAAVVVLAVLFYLGPADLAPAGRVAVALLVFAGSAWLLTRAFRRRSGLAFKLR